MTTSATIQSASVPAGSLPARVIERLRLSRAGRQFEAFAEMRGVDVRWLSPDVLREAVNACAHCDCRVPCRRWLRTGVWHYDGDPRCPNATLLQR